MAFEIDNKIEENSWLVKRILVRDISSQRNVCRRTKQDLIVEAKSFLMSASTSYSVEAI